jgi:hypothetical protein
LFLRLLGGLQIFLRGRQRFMSEPGLDRTHIDSCAKPARRGAIPKFVEMPFFLVEAGGLCDLLATVVQIAIVEVALGRRKNQAAIGDARMLAQDVRYLLRERNDALFPVFGKEVVLRLGPHMDPAVPQIQVAPV